MDQYGKRMIRGDDESDKARSDRHVLGLQVCNFWQLWLGGKQGLI